MIKILLVDNEKLIRSGLTLLLNTTSDIQVIGEAENVQQAFEFCKDLKPDCVLMDIRMPDSNGIEGVRLIKEAYPEINILMLTTFQDSEYIVEAIKYGASGYLLKDSSYEEIAEAIRLASQGNMVFDGNLNQQISSQITASRKTAFEAGDYNLKDREVEIIRLVASGMTNQEIADQLFLSLGTVKNNISLILQKLNLRDRTQLAIFAFEKGLK